MIFKKEAIVALKPEFVLFYFFLTEDEFYSSQLDGELQALTGV